MFIVPYFDMLAGYSDLKLEIIFFLNLEVISLNILRVLMLKVPVHKWQFVFSFQKSLGSSFLSIGVEIHSDVSFLSCRAGYFM